MMVMPLSPFSFLLTSVITTQTVHTMPLHFDSSARQSRPFDCSPGDNLTDRSSRPTVGDATGVNGCSRDRRQRPHRWYHEDRIWFVALLVCSTCALTVFHVQGSDHPLSWLRQSVTTTRPLESRLPLTGLFTDRVPSQHLGRRQDRDDEGTTIPAWADYNAISSNTLPLSNTIAPVYMHHLFEAKVEQPYNRVHIVSAFVDSRPLVVPNARREILMHGVLNGTEWVKNSAHEYPDGFIECTVLIRQPDGTIMTTSGGVKSLLAYHLTGHHMTLSQGQFVCSLARMPQTTYSAVDWDEAEIYVTLNPIDTPPPNDVFIRVRPIAALDLDEHHTGRGQGGVCLAPLRSELYASSLRDHISYQKSLGFTRIYIYLMDPGRITLSVLRELASTNSNIVLIRWGIPRDWSVTAGPGRMPMDRKFDVDPSKWSLPGIEVLDPAREALLGTSWGQESVGVWYWGQNLAAQDCQMRAMADGVRWVAVVDWDEYLVMQPSDKLTWSPPSRFADPIAAMEPFLQWARQVPRPLTFHRHTGYMLSPSAAQGVQVDVEAVAKGMLPTSLLFAQSFGEYECQSRSPPPETPVLKEVMDRFGHWDWVHPGATVPQAFSTPVASPYFPYGTRSKKILDPWAYFLDSTHFTEVGYVAYALDFGACSKSSSIITNKEMSQRECVETVVRAFGSHGVPVPVTKAVIDNRPKFAGRPSKITGSSGSLRHFRVKMLVVLATLRLTKNLTDLSPSLLSSDESREVRSDHSTRDCHSLPQEWSVVHVMEQSLKWIFEDRAEARTTVHQRPTPKVVVTSTQGSRPARPSTIKKPVKTKVGVVTTTQHSSGSSSKDSEMEEIEGQPTRGSFKLRQAWSSSPLLFSTGALLVAVAAALIYLLVAQAEGSDPTPEGYVMVEQA
ncbi:BQ2448_2758 [Microbotryum intermedium]|uniref:BQ2448_2758 protein n=1 Tax=Microbotryum intermedium TaxID=269621 RepID=A0A238FBE6_9BASI|nr:BQ2448_2758 [Microbotryum intermedium]